MKLIVGIVVTILTSISALIYYVSVKSTVEQEAYALYSSTITSLAQELDSVVLDVKNMSLVAAESFVNDEVSPAGALAMLSEMREAMYAYGYDNIVIALNDKKTYISLDNVYIDGVSVTPTFQHYSKPWYTETARLGKVQVFGPYMNTFAHKVQIVVSAPIFDSKGVFAGVAAIFTDFTKIEAVLEDYAARQLGGELSLLSAKRTIIATPTAGDIDFMKKIEEVDPGLEPILAQVNTPEVGILEYVYEGKPKLYFQQGLSEADLYVSWRLDEGEALGTASTTQLISLAIFVSSLVLMVVFLRRLLYPIIEGGGELGEDEATAGLLPNGLPDYFVEKYQITAREQEVIEILVQGKTDKEISLELGIAVSTVQAHLKHSYQKTGAAGRFALVALVYTEVEELNKEPQEG
jgi:DNA-binding CsgD family transcriptional regulator